MEEDNPFYIGRIGTVGQRAGNFALQNADCVLFLGTRNNIRQASYNYENFAKNAFKIVVDIDKNELYKPTIDVDLRINADLKNFIPKMLEKLNDDNFKIIPVEMQTKAMEGNVDLTDGEGYFSSAGTNWQSAEEQGCNICLKAYTLK